LNYHYEEGKAWLANSEGGKNTTVLSYAAFEFRLAIERIGLQYWFALTPGGIEEISLRDIKSFKSIEKRIYQLAGHQRAIEARFEFASILPANIVAFTFTDRAAAELKERIVSRSLRQSLDISGGSFLIFFTRPISLVCWVVVAGLLMYQKYSTSLSFMGRGNSHEVVQDG
jgi:hypothetical protein